MYQQSLPMKRFLLVCILIGAFCGLTAQTPEELVYIHTDRDVYTPGDQLRFKAWVHTGSDVVSKSNQLFIWLLGPSGKLVAESENPVSNNQSAGSIILPDTLSDGEYRMLGFTGQMEMGSPQDAFTKKVFIRHNEFPGLFIRLTMDAPWYIQGESVQLGIHIRLQNNKPFNSEQFYYLATKNGIPYQNGIGQTDEKGDASLLVRIPATGEEGLITISVNTELLQSKGSATILVPGGGMPVFLNFFPEGGTLVDGLETKVGFRAQDFQGDPFPFEGLVLDQDNQPVDSIKSDSLGFGSFLLLPDKTDPLKVRITKPAGIVKDFPLPLAQSKGLQLMLKSRSGEWLDFHVRTNNLHSDQHMIAIAESYGRIVTQIPIVLDDTLSFRIPVKGMKSGIMSVSLMNGEGNTLARRPVFLAPPASLIVSDSGTGKGKAIDMNKLNVAVEDPDGQPVAAILSVAVYDAIMSPDWNRQPDIRSWFLLGRAAGALPPGYFSNSTAIDAKMLDNLMLSRIDSTINGKQIPRDFRNRLLRLYTPGPFEQLVAQFHRDRFFNEYMLSGKPDLSSFIKNNAGNLQEMGIIPGKPDQDDRIRQQLEIGIPVLNVIRSIKPYTLSGNQIYFTKGKNSLEYPKGALFIIDGSEKGYNIDVLNYYSPYDIAEIKVSEKISDILKYSADAGALILITTKKGGGSSAEVAARPARLYDPTLYWNPEVVVGGVQPVTLNLPRPKLKSAWMVVIRGIDSKGNSVEAVMKRN